MNVRILKDYEKSASAAAKGVDILDGARRIGYAEPGPRGTAMKFIHLPADAPEPIDGALYRWKSHNSPPD